MSLACSRMRRHTKSASKFKLYGDTVRRSPNRCWQEKVKAGLEIRDQLNFTNQVHFCASGTNWAYARRAMSRTTMERRRYATFGESALRSASAGRCGCNKRSHISEDNGLQLGQRPEAPSVREDERGSADCTGGARARSGRRNATHKSRAKRFIDPIALPKESGEAQQKRIGFRKTSRAEPDAAIPPSLRLSNFFVDC